MGTPADPDGIEHAFKHPKVVFSHGFRSSPVRKRDVVTRTRT